MLIEKHLHGRDLILICPSTSFRDFYLPAGLRKACLGPSRADKNACAVIFICRQRIAGQVHM